MPAAGRGRTIEHDGRLNGRRRNGSRTGHGASGKRQAGKNLGKHLGKRAAQEAGKQVAKKAAKTAGKKVAAKIATRAAIEGGLAAATGGASTLVSAGVQVAVRYLTVKRCLLILALLMLPSALFGSLLVMMIASMSELPTPQAPTRVPGIPPTVLDAYTRAAAAAPTIAPGCHGMRWSILAGIGKIETDHLAGHPLKPNGDVVPPYLGPRLDGSGAGGNLTPVHDTDHGRWDHDTRYDRAVGLMQIMPSTWSRYGRDGNADGVADPHNVYDSAQGAVTELCQHPADLGDRRQLSAALFRYNHSGRYVQRVLHWIDTYDRSGQTVAPGVGGNARGQTIVNAARRWLSLPYSWGGGGANGPSYGIGRGAGTWGFDCSGLAQYAYHQAGINIPRTTQEGYLMPARRRDAVRIPPGQGIAVLQPGDLMYFGSTDIHHVAIYAGKGQIIEAPFTGSHVRISSASRLDYAGAVRFP